MVTACPRRFNSAPTARYGCRSPKDPNVVISSRANAYYGAGVELQVTGGTLSVKGVAHVKLPPFLLDRWIEQKNSGTIEYDLASSTGPVWTLRELLALSDRDEWDALLDTRVSYTSASGSPALRAAIAGLEGVEPDAVQVMTGASEALL